MTELRDADASAGFDFLLLLVSSPIWIPIFIGFTCLRVLGKLLRKCGFHSADQFIFWNGE